MRRFFALLACLMLIGLCHAAGVFAQVTDLKPYRVLFQGVPMEQALEEFVHTTGADLVFATDLVAGRDAFCVAKDRSIDRLLRCVLRGTGLDFVRSSTGTYVVISALEQPAQYGELAGVVVDRETGTPLPYANVLLAEAATGTTTNEAGLFSFASLLSGMHRVVVTYVGYESAVDSILVRPGRANTLEVALEPGATWLDPVVIDGLEQRLPAREIGVGRVAGRRIYDPAALCTVDVVRGASRLAGVAVLQPTADLHIQGGAAGEHLTLLDDVPVRDPVSLGRHLGAFSPLAIRSLTVRRAGFGVARGSHLSGVVSVAQDVTGPDRLELEVDPVSANSKIRRNFRFGTTRHGTLMVAGRTSLWGVYKDPGVDALLRRWNVADPLPSSLWIGEPVTTSTLQQSRSNPQVGFSDLHVASRIDLGDFRTLDFTLYRARNHVDSELSVINASPTTPDDHLMLTRDLYDWTNWAGRVRYSWLWGARTAASLQVEGSRHHSGYEYRSAHQPIGAGETPETVLQMLQAGIDDGPGTDEDHSLREYTAKAVINHSLSASRHVELGVSASRLNSRFRFGNQFVAPFDQVGGVWQGAGYLNGTLSLGWRLTLDPGIRLTYAPTRRTAYFEPRLAIRYDRKQSRIGPYALRFAGGVYRQYINQFDLTSIGSTSVVPSILFWLPVDSTRSPQRAYHLSSEALFMPGKAWTLRIETYYKWLSHLLDIDYLRLLLGPAGREVDAEVPQSSFIGEAHGKAYGGSIKIAYQTRRWDVAVQYAYSFTVRTFSSRFDGKEMPTPWNEPHRVAFDLRLRLAPGLHIGLNARSEWGRSWALRRIYYDYGPFFPTSVSFTPFNLDRPSDQTIRAYQRVDLGLTYRRAFGGTQLMFRAFVNNIFDRNNVYDQGLIGNYNGVSTRNRTLPGRYPLFSIRVTK